MCARSPRDRDRDRQHDRDANVTRYGFFDLQVDGGIGLATFERRPVNAVSLEVYEDLGRLVDAVETSDEVRVLVLCAPDDARAWCGGADVSDFVGIDKTARHQRYQRINASLPRFAALSRPTIACINAHVVGIGVILAALCDLRVAADSATFACPEIDFGLVAGGGGLFSYLNMPESFVREMLYTGRRFSAEEMRAANFLNYVVPRPDVLDTALGIARSISRKSLPAIKARKRVLLQSEAMSWFDNYLLAQEESGDLVENRDAVEGVSAFLEGREPRLLDE